MDDGLIDKQTLSEVESQVRTAIDYEVAYSHDVTLYSIATEIKDIMVAVISGSREVVSGGKKVSREAAKLAYCKLTSDHVLTVIDHLLNYPGKIARIDNFIATMLYNAAFTQNIETFSGFTAATGIRLIE